MIPLRDANPTRRRPVVTLALIATCFVVFCIELAIQASQGDPGLESFFGTWGVVPKRLLGAVGRGELVGSATFALLTHQFLHAGWPHIAGNMLYLWIFGNNVEDRLGRPAFLVLYLGGGVIAALAQVAVSPGVDMPLVGASGAIAAVLGAYLVLYPGARVLSIVFLGFFFGLVEVPAIILLGVWFALQLIDVLGSVGMGPSTAGVAIFAHIGGFVAGLVVGLAVRGRRRQTRTPVG